MNETSQNQNTDNKFLNMRSENSQSMLEELDLLFKTTWNIFCNGASSKNKEKVQEKYNGLQAWIMQQATQMDVKYAVEYQILSLKLVEMMYNELVVNSFKKNAEKQGLSDLEIKGLLHDKIFGAEDKNRQEQKNIEETTNDQMQEKKESERKIDEENGNKDVSYESAKAYSKFEQKSKNREIVINYKGRLNYRNASGFKSYVNKYSILIFTKENKAPIVTLKEVYGDINFSMMHKNKEYQEAILEKLLSLENIYKNGNESYIGKISPTGKEGQYEICYSPEEYSAVRVYNEQNKMQEREFKGEEK